MPYTLHVVMEEDRMFELLHRAMLERIVQDLGFPEFKKVGDELVCSYPSMPDYMNVQRFELGGMVIEKPKSKRKAKNARLRQE